MTHLVVASVTGHLRQDQAAEDTITSWTWGGIRLGVFIVVITDSSNNEANLKKRKVNSYLLAFLQVIPFRSHIFEESPQRYTAIA